jgi:hypothetical protein
MTERAPVVMEAPAAEPPAPAPEVEQEAQPQPEPAPRGKKAKITKEGRAWLREACANLNLGRDRGNSIAEWLDKQPDVEVVFIGRVPEPIGHISSTPDVVPVVNRHDPMT